MSTFDVVFVVIILGLIASYLVADAIPPFRRWATRRWVTREIGDSTPELIDEMSRVLAVRRRRTGLGCLVGFGVSLAVALPTRSQMSPSSSMSSIVSTGVVLGLLIAVAVGAARETASAAPPHGVRVAMSTRPRPGWFMSRAGLVVLGFAAAGQLLVGYLRISEAWPYGGPDVSTVSAIVAMAVLVLVWIATLSFLPWLADRPFYAGNELGLRVEVALRRDLFFMITRMQYVLIVYVGLVVGGVDWTDVPVEVRRAHSTQIFQLSMLTLSLLCVGGIVQAWLTPRKPVRHLPPPQVSFRTSPAPRATRP